MTCIHLSELLKVELTDYQQKLQERKQYFDNITRYDVWIYLVERDFQKRFFNSWAEHERQEFCEGCDSNGNCDVKN